MLSALNARKARDRRLQSFVDNLDVRAELAEQRTHDAFRLLEHRAEQMLRFNLLILISFGQLDGRLNRFLAREV